MADSKENKDDVTIVAEKDSEKTMEHFAEKVTAKLANLFSAKGKSGKETEVSETVSLSDYNALKEEYKNLSKSMDELKTLVVDREKEHVQFSEKVKSLESQTRAEKAEAICKQAILDGVPTVVVNHFKPILMSEMGEKTIKLSEKVADKTVEVEKPLTDLIKGFFKIYPNKVDFADRTGTRTEEPGESSEDLVLSEIEKLAKEKMAANPKLPYHEAYEKAGVEIYSKKRGGK